MTTIKKTLKQIQSDKTNAYDHLKQLIGKLILSRQTVDQVEKYSFDGRGAPKPDIVLNVRQSYNLMKQYQCANRLLLGKINTGTVQEPQEPASLTYQPNIIEEAKMFAKLGVGFGDDETYRIYKSLAILSVKKNTKQLKLWGKILGTQKDYYIAQGLADGGEEAGQLPANVQPKGTGINKYNYWATTCLTSQWTQLPIITPEQLKTSRKLKYLFTGNLSTSVLSNPIFHGQQSHLLKCQIVRISTTCTILPKGIFIPNPEDPKDIISPEQPQPLPEIQTLSSPQNWVYLNPSILKNGRISLIKPEGLEGEEQQKWVKQQNQKDPSQIRLKSIAIDYKNNWAIRQIKGQKIKAIGHPKNTKDIDTTVVGIKSILWPGWTNVAYGNLKWGSVYIGYGWKAKQQYYPKQPQQILQQAEDRQQVVIE